MSYGMYMLIIIALAIQQHQQTIKYHKVFTRGAMQAFLLKNIVPKLEAALLHLNINPVNQVSFNFLNC